VLAPNPADNYHRWWNNSWTVIESAGQENAGAWTAAKERRLAALVRGATRQNLWIRFYTLDGATREGLSAHGWFKIQDVQFWLKRGRQRASERSHSRRCQLHRQ
jgi:hypothetical protein